MKKTLKIALPLIILGLWLVFKVENVNDISTVLAVIIAVLTAYRFTVIYIVYLPAVVIPMAAYLLAAESVIVLLSPSNHWWFWLISSATSIGLTFLVAYIVRSKLREVGIACIFA